MEATRSKTSRAKEPTVKKVKAKPKILIEEDV